MGCGTADKAVEEYRAGSGSNNVVDATGGKNAFTPVLDKSVFAYGVKEEPVCVRSKASRFCCLMIADART